MDRRRQLYIEALLKRLHPGQGHADPGISLAAREQLQQLIRRTGEVDLFDLEIAFGEEPSLIGDRYAHIADRIGIPGDLQFARHRTRGDGLDIGRHAADRGVRHRIRQR